MSKANGTITHLGQLTPDPANARKHNQRNIGTISDGLREVGAARSIVIDEDGVILAGNGVSEAAAEAGITKVQVVDVDGETLVAVRRKGLTPLQKARLALIDNRASDMSEWDAEQLAALANQGVPLDDLWSEDELAELLRDTEAATGTGEGENAPEPDEQQTRVVAGDLWQCGRHRILAGDSTKATDVARLMQGEKADMVFADPPYGYEYQSNMRTKSAKFEVLKNDDKLLSGFIPHLHGASAGWVLVCTSWKVISEWMEATKPLGDLQNVIVWDKGGGGMGDLAHSLLTDYELILAYNRGAAITGKRIGSVWSIGKDNANDYEHATQKPVGLPLLAFDTFAPRDGTIYDPFLGSGTTLIAAARTGRRCYGIEIEPKYVNVILTRYEAETGNTATLLERL